MLCKMSLSFYVREFFALARYPTAWSFTVVRYGRRHKIERWLPSTLHLTDNMQRRVRSGRAY